MKFLFDFFPILIFFIAYKLGDIFVATLALILATGAQVLWSRYKQGYFAKMPLITFLVVTLFGSVTLLLRNEIFIKWKPSVLYWGLGVGLLISQVIGNKPLLERLGGNNIKLPPPIWRQLNLSWGAFCLILGFLNLYVAYSFDTAIWVNFKLFGLMGLTLVFVIMQAIYVAYSTQKTH